MSHVSSTIRHLFILTVLLAVASGCTTSPNQPPAATAVQPAPAAAAPATAPTSAPMAQATAALPQAPAKSSKNVLGTATFIADIAQNVAGSRTKVGALVPVGSDPHGFEPTPSDVANVAKSDVLIMNGAGYEEYLDKLIKNAGGSRSVIEAAGGLTSRNAREGEVAEMSDVDFVDAMCVAAGETKAEATASGQTVDQAAELPSEEGLFEVSLSRMPNGSFGGYLKYATDEGGDFWIGSGTGKVVISTAKDSTAVEAEKNLQLRCGGLAQGNIVEMEKDGEYVLALSGFAQGKAQLLIGPAGGHKHQQADPHFWMDPNLVVKYVENIRDGLSKADPDGAATYAANAQAYIAQLKDLDKWISSQVAQIPPERRLLVTNHESFGYFADRYGFKIVGTIMPSVSTNASPSAQQLARLVDRVKASGARAIFLETATNPQLAQQIARETGIKVVTQLYSESTTDAGGPAPTYIEMIKYDTKAIVDALK